MTFDNQDNKQLAAFLIAHAIADYNIERHNYWHEFRSEALKQAKTLGLSLPEFIKLAFGCEDPSFAQIDPKELVVAMVNEIQDNCCFKK